MNPWFVVLAVAICYFLGNINPALIISKLKKRDIRKADSGNPGAMNMFRNFGKALGVLTLFLDAAKGALGSFIGWLILGELGIYIGGVSTIVGHIFPVFLKFKGGKGIAGTIGVCMVIHPIAALISFVTGVLFLIVTKMGAVTSFVIITVPLALKSYEFAKAGENLAAVIIMFCIFLLTLIKHRHNIKKLFMGTENKTILFKKKRPASPKNNQK